MSKNEQLSKPYYPQKYTLGAPFIVLACRVEIATKRRDVIKKVIHTGAERVYCTVELTFSLGFFNMHANSKSTTM